MHVFFPPANVTFFNSNNKCYLKVCCTFISSIVRLLSKLFKIVVFNTFYHKLNFQDHLTVNSCKKCFSKFYVTPLIIKHLLFFHFKTLCIKARVQNGNFLISTCDKPAHTMRMARAKSWHVIFLPLKNTTECIQSFPCVRICYFSRR